MEDFNNDVPQPDVADITTPDGNDTSDFSDDSISLEDIEKTLGKKFPNKQAALKSWKDTNSYVGKVGQLEKKVKEMETSVPQSSGVVTRQEFEEYDFFKSNPDYAEHKDIITGLKAANPDKSLSEIVEMPSLKKLISEANEYRQIQSTKSVLHSNPRIGIATNKLDEAREKIDKGDARGAEELATQAIVETFFK